MSSAEPSPGNVRRRGLSVRTKLALSYAGFVAVAGMTPFAVGFLVLRFLPDGNLFSEYAEVVPRKEDLIEVFAKYTWWALGLLVVFGLVGGWLLAGLVLRPLDQITVAGIRVYGGSFGHRIALPGRRDELTTLADVFDTMLGTLEGEKRFAANASHELRTPHATIRTLVEVAQADPEHRDVDELLRRIAHTNDRAIATVEALLTLARVGGGATGERRPVDLAALASEAIDAQSLEATTRSIRIATSFEPVSAVGDRTLLGQLTANLLRNAMVHNVANGRVTVSTSQVGTSAVLTVTNTGHNVDPAIVPTLTEPFVRGSRRVRGQSGEGLGLAIVAAIIRVHDGSLGIRAREEGGLTVQVELPAASTRPPLRSGR